jgi:hypothetical protein
MRTVKRQAMESEARKNQGIHSNQNMAVLLLT